jgi:hypothetical protein
MQHIFKFLESLKSKISKPNVRIIVEAHPMDNSDGLRFQFLWYDGEDPLKLSYFVSISEIDRVVADEFIIDKIVNVVNGYIEKRQKEKA